MCGLFEKTSLYFTFLYFLVELTLDSTDCHKPRFQTSLPKRNLLDIYSRGSSQYQETKYQSTMGSGVAKGHNCMTYLLLLGVVEEFPGAIELLRQLVLLLECLHSLLEVKLQPLVAFGQQFVHGCRQPGIVLLIHLLTLPSLSTYPDNT